MRCGQRPPRRHDPYSSSKGCAELITAAYHCSFFTGLQRQAALGIGSGDEVILADTNWIASAAPITYLGAKPVFVDILPDTWCLDPALVEAAITPRTKAIVAVWEFLKTHPEFEIDKSIGHKLLITVASDGYLRRMR